MEGLKGLNMNKYGRLDLKSLKFINNKIIEGSMIYERLYKEFDDDKTIHTIASSDYNDPKLWEDPKSGFWIEKAPQAVAYLNDH